MEHAAEILTPPERRRRAALKGIRIADRVVQKVIDIAVILLLLIGIYFLADTIYVYYNAGLGGMLPAKPENGDLSVLKEVSEDAVGWITLDDTTIDYPIMQGEDNLEYLNKDPYGDYALAGSIYLDSRNASDFSDDYSLLYGHYMSGGYMFGALDRFEDPDFYADHQTGTLVTERGEFPVRVLAFAYTHAANETVFDPTQRQTDLRQWIRSNASNYSPQAEGGRIVALSTCRSPTSTRRMIVFVTIEE